MLDNLKALGSIALGVAVLLALLVLIPVVFFMGVLWATAHLLIPMIVIGWIMLALDIFIFLPLCLSKSLRGWMAGILIFISSFLFGIVLWLSSFITTLGAWGIGAVIAGLLFAGVGVIPMAALILVLHGQWADL